jgi:predicted transcriptional regulator
VATPSAPAVALLSIHPQYADAIMRGDKRVEFRKQPFARPVEHVVIYATAPVQRIVGTFRVAGCDVAEPAELWRRYGDVGGIERDDFEGYYGRRSSGVAIAIEGSPIPMDLPLDVVDQVRPPQGFAYLTTETASRIGLTTTSELGGNGERPATATPRDARSSVWRRFTSAMRGIFMHVHGPVGRLWPPNGRHESREGVGGSGMVTDAVRRFGAGS